MNKSIDDVILSHSSRGMNLLYDSINKRQLCKEASEGFLTLEKGVVFIYTGFYVNGFAETDGPIGTYFLAKALKKLDFDPIILTDEYCKDYFKDIKTIYVNKKQDNVQFYKQLLSSYSNIVAHFSIERCGRDKHNDYINSKSLSIKNFTISLDDLFVLGSKSSPSFAVGDGGNEIGMGNFQDFLENDLGTNSSVIKCDYPIISSVSNWGAYGFIAYLQKKSKLKLLPKFSEVDEYLDFILCLGCVDGIKGSSSKSVDGKNWDLEKEILEDLNILSI